MMKKAVPESLSYSYLLILLFAWIVLSSVKYNRIITVVTVWSLHSFLSLKDLLMGLTPPGARAILNLATWHFLHLHILKMAKRTFLWETMLYFTLSVVAPQWYFLTSALTVCAHLCQCVCLVFLSSLKVNFYFTSGYIYVRTVTTKKHTVLATKLSRLQ